MNKTFRKLACVCLTAVMASTFVAGNVLAFADTSENVSGGFRYDTVTAENVTGKIDLTGIGLQNLNSSVLENAGITVKSSDYYTVIVTLEQNSVLESISGSQTVSGYLSSFSGARTLDAIENSQKAFYNKLSKSGINYVKVNSYSTITNSVAIKVKWEDIPKLKSLPSVQSVVLSSAYAYPEAADTTNEKASAVTNPNDVYSTGIYDSSDYLQYSDGSKVTIAILDTGLDYTHDAFSIMPQEVALTKNDVADKMRHTTFEASKYSGATVDDVYINAKVPFAYDYADKDADVYPAYSQHGVHVAGISAGDSPYGYTDKNGNYVDEQFKGVAPKAQLVICKVFTDNFESSDLGGAVTEDILAALEDCVNLGVDVINMSLGTAAGFSSVEIEGDSEGQWMNDVYTRVNETGISLVCAASNEYSAGYGSVFGTNLTTNPDSGTVGSPSTFVGAMSVASINGQQSYYMNVGSQAEPVFFTAASDVNYVTQDFLDMLGVGAQPQTFTYVLIPGKGRAGDYSTVRSYFDNKGDEKIIAVIERGSTTFQDKIEIAMRAGADAAIIYNNVAGTIGISLGDIDDPIPTAAVSMDAGAILNNASADKTTGTITLSTTYQAGPFMNDYSSWGSTPDLQLKPDITAYGGEITSAVSGGFSELSGTSMASPNLAGVTALIRSKLKADGYTGTNLTQLTNQIIMSTATTVYNEYNLPYSPRKQGAGLATLENIFTTSAYLSTDRADGRPKAELGEDEKKEGKYDITFYVNNMGTSTLEFKTESIFMTETLSSNGLSVAERAYLLTDNAAVWTVNGTSVAEGSTISVSAGGKAEIKVTLTLSAAEKKYLDDTFENGMYVEGFINLLSQTEGQCNLTLPFMGFYGDWEAAPMLDYDCYDIAEFQKDTSYTDETRPQAQVWATQAFASYYNTSYVVPMGSYVYVQDPNAEQVYTNREYAAVSGFNDFIDDESTQNHMTTWRIKALYAGLLRNAELVTYDLYNTDTGELVVSDNIYRVNKAYAAGGSATPAQVLLDLEPDVLGLEANGRYSFEFHFYFNADDKDNPEYDNEENTFSMIFYVDYEAPTLVNSSIRYYDYKENNQDKQRVYLDLEIYDNHYAQAAFLCYPKMGASGVYEEVVLATEYITAITNPVRNGTTTVTIEITDYIDDNSLMFVQIVDYALNYSVFQLDFSSSKENPLPDSFTIAADDRITEVNGEKVLTIGLHEAYKINLDYTGEANLSNFGWRSMYENYVAVKNGEVFGVAVGSSTITVTGKNGYNQKIRVVVTDKEVALINPTISFGTIINFDQGIQKASGTVKVGAGQNFTLDVIFEPWYYPVDGTSFVWESSNTKIATVDENGNVTVNDTKGSTSITAKLYDKSGSLVSTASVTLNVQEPFTISASQLTKYSGNGGDVVIPDDKNVMTIAADAFKDNNNITSIVIPATVTQIKERAFKNCTALEAVYFVAKSGEEVELLSKLELILKNAFEGCVNLKTIDFTNVKTITLGPEVFLGCTSLEQVLGMENIGTMNKRAFAGCTSLESVNITGVHNSYDGVFAGCTSLKEVITGFYTSIGTNMFNGCTSLSEITLRTSIISDKAFFNCVSLENVVFDSSNTPSGSSFDITIGEYAFTYGADEYTGANSYPRSNSLKTVDFGGNTVISIGDAAFYGCSALTGFDKSIFSTQVALGDKVFEATPVTFTEAQYVGTVLLVAPTVITSDFEIRNGTTEIAAYAFSSSTLADGVTEIKIPSTVTKIGEGAFAYLTITSITLPENISEIADYTFYGVNTLTDITIPASVTSIGASVFYGCEALASVNFAGQSKLISIGDEAFAFCLALTSIELPENCTAMGDAVFYNCSELKTAKLPSLTYLGRDTFWKCDNLEEVTFGENATTAGSYTFAETPVTSVALGNKTTILGEGVFYSCTELTSIDLKNVTEAGDYAFAYCTALTDVTNLDKLVVIGDYAFAACTGLKTLNLTSAEVIGEGAFSGIGFTSLNLPAVKEIGAMAFMDGAVSTVNLPASLTFVADGAFVGSAVTGFTVAEANKIFFTDGGVLYRIVENFATGKEAYELCAYPSAKTLEAYEVIDGTVMIRAFAFYSLSGRLTRVIMPYSLKAIGDSAFYASGITYYEFTSYQAPALYAEFYYEEQSEYPYSFYYTNFENEFKVQLGALTGTTADIYIIYPVNGTGYDNYVYTNYFNHAPQYGDEVLETDTYELKNMIEAFYPLEEVQSWNTDSFEVNEENTATVRAFANEVAAAHEIYLRITAPTQLELLGSENEQKLLAIEEALKAVKQRFGIAAVPVSLEVSADSTHKTEYKAGEIFDMTGLVLIVSYDDYSTEIIDLSSGLITLTAAYDGVELTTLNRYVIVSAYGLTVRVAITVTEGLPVIPDDDAAKLNPAVIYGPIIGVVAVALIAVAAVLFIKKSKSKSAKVQEVSQDQTSVETEQPDDGQTIADADGEKEE